MTEEEGKMNVMDDKEARRQYGRIQVRKVLIFISIFIILFTFLFSGITGAIATGSAPPKLTYGYIAALTIILIFPLMILCSVVGTTDIYYFDRHFTVYIIACVVTIIIIIVIAIIEIISVSLYGFGPFYSTANGWLFGFAIIYFISFVISVITLFICVFLIVNVSRIYYKLHREYPPFKMNRKAIYDSYKESKRMTTGTCPKRWRFWDIYSPMMFRPIMNWRYWVVWTFTLISALFLAVNLWMTYFAQTHFQPAPYMLFIAYFNLIVICYGRYFAEITHLKVYSFWIGAFFPILLLIHALGLIIWTFVHVFGICPSAVVCNVIGLLDWVVWTSMVLHWIHIFMDVILAAIIWFWIWRRWDYRTAQNPNPKMPMAFTSQIGASQNYGYQQIKPLPVGASTHDDVTKRRVLANSSVSHK